MTISSDSRTAGPFLGAGTTAVLPFAFKVFQTSDVQVIHRDASGDVSILALSTDYTVTLNSDQDVSPGGIVTLLSALASGHSITLTSEMSAIQPLDLTNAGGFFPQTLENALDRLTILVQQALKRNTLRAPVGEELDYLPGATSRANMLMGFNATGQPTLLVGAEADSATALQLDLIDSTLAAHGAGQVAFNSALSYPSGSVGLALAGLADKAEEHVTFEDFGAVGNGIADDTAEIQAGLDWARDNSRSIRGDRKYKTTAPVSIRQDRLDPGVNQDFTTINVFINELVYAGTGSAIAVASPTASLWVKKLVGPGTGSGTDGLYITGQGDGGRHRVDWVKGFDRCVNLDVAYSHTVEVGYVHDALRGVRINGNANRIIGGRIGGQFSTADIDGTSCNVGVEITAGSVANEIHANIEYCRRTTDSVGLADSGIATFFRGYIESNNLYSIQALGQDGRYEVLNGGNNNTHPAGYQMGGMNNRMQLLSQAGAIEETPSGSVNTLQFLTLQKMESVGTSSIENKDGRREHLQGSGQYRNEIAHSSDLTNVVWGQSVLGAASWADVTATVGSNGFGWGGLAKSTRFVFPARTGDADIWRLGQPSLSTVAGTIGYGIFARVISGEIEIMLRLNETANNVQTRTIEYLGTSSKFVQVGRPEFLKQSADAADATFEISFRTHTGCTIDLMGAFLVNQPGVIVPPTNLSNTKRPLLPGKQIPGNMLPAGLVVNGALQLQASPPIAAAGDINPVEYPVYLVTGGWTGTLALYPGVENACIVIKRDGVASTGAINLTPTTTTIDGSASAINLAAAWSYCKLVFSAAHGWLNVT